MPKDQNNHHFYLAVMHLGDTWTFDEADSACTDADRLGSNSPYVADSKGNQIAVCVFRQGS